jgi:5'-phosphate synthase pdxT subunit
MIVSDRDHLGLLDITTRRNAFGRQLASFEDDIDLAGLPGPPFRAVFIRAPWVEQLGEGVEVLAEVRGHPVAVREGRVSAFSFHPELTADDRIHEWFVAACRG